MHQAAVEMLERTGMFVEHPGVQQTIAGRPGFVRRDNGRVCIAPDQVERWRTNVSRRSSPPAHDPSAPAFTCVTSDRTPFIVSDDATSVRQMTTADVIKWTKLITALNDRGVTGCTPGVPGDVPLLLQPLEQFMIGARYCPRGGMTSQVCDVRTARVVRELNAVYGRARHQSVWCPSPLILGGSECEIMWHFRSETDSANVGSMPIMGLTAPCDPIAAFTLAVAECLGGAVILSELLPGIPVGISPHPEPADMRTGAMVFGSPEWELLDLMHRDVYRYYGQRWPPKYLHTTAPLPNEQAALERMCSAVTGILSGYRRFGPLGQLSLDEVFSPELVILDLEMLGHACRVGSGGNSGDGLALPQLAAVVDEVISGNMMFGAHETTVRNMRLQYWQPTVLSRCGFRQWQNRGQPEVVRAARREAERLVDSCDYEAPSEILRELQSICDRYKSQL